jgi:uncharacterized protein
MGHNTNSENHNHDAIFKRLRRAEGHLKSVLNMIEAGRTCLEITQQLHAVEAAISNAKRELIHEHIDKCLELNGDDTRLAELKSLSKYL